MKNKLLLITIATATAIGVIYACSKDKSNILDGEKAKIKAIDRSVSVLNTEAFEMTANDGSCYTVTLEWMSDNSVRYSKVPGACSSNASDHKGVYFSHPKSPDSSGKINLDDGSTYFYIPLTGTQVLDISGSHLICFCEGNEPEPWCEGIPANCYWHLSGKWKKCNEEPCCIDCDMRACIGSEVGDSILLQKANGVVVRAGSVRSIYYGGNTQIEISYIGNSVIATRSEITGTAHPKNLVNLTTLELSNGKISIPAGGDFWFIPFEPAVAASIPSVDPQCSPDYQSECTECELRVDRTGCYECFCKEVSGTGDCDMKPNSYGGILIETTQVQLTDL